MTDGTRLCEVEGCEALSRNKGRARLCEMHYYRLRRTGTTDTTRPWHRRGSCSVDGCDSPERHDGVCIRHWTRIRRHGDPDTVLPRPSLSGEQSASWTGDDATYVAMHSRVRKARGPAKLLACADCGSQARHWSYDRTDPGEKQSELGPYSTDLSHYEPRCVPCHKRFDLDAIREGRPDYDSPHRRARQNDGPAEAH